MLGDIGGFIIIIISIVAIRIILWIQVDFESLDEWDDTNLEDSLPDQVGTSMSMSCA